MLSASDKSKIALMRHYFSSDKSKIALMRHYLSLFLKIKLYPIKIAYIENIKNRSLI